jgi:hypothetical protein
MLPIDNPERVVQVVRSDNGYVYNVIRGTFLVHDGYVEFKTNPPKRQFGDPQLSVKIYRDEIGTVVEVAE